MQRLLDNARAFKRRISAESDKYRRLAEGQWPKALFITCSDSRVLPSHITGAGPGELFELRTAGHIVPPYERRLISSEAATISYALDVLGVGDIVVCGHSHCGAVDALVRGADLSGLPEVGGWLELARPALAPVIEGPPGDPALAEAVRRHVTAQLASLYGYPLVRDRVAAGELRLHGWFYRIDTGEVEELAADGAFRPPLPPRRLGDQYQSPLSGDPLEGPPHGGPRQGAHGGPQPGPLSGS
ncbi:carbonic anhydrase [Streptomyces himalayensis]|uniref:carbonic anhydrase n=1 Tax=Streptomyces himalayensis subsp. himalayensis TaxID=2756131 RepID=A0A7W0IBF7_9ACTN|nr:carbonic anhydrase [Streptomyces himalayensis]MBA2949131.1 carbonic anhydrase [Streptomyces himalayensis subsp. himalayensis]